LRAKRRLGWELAHDYRQRSLYDICIIAALPRDAKLSCPPLYIIWQNVDCYGGRALRGKPQEDPLRNGRRVCRRSVCPVPAPVWKTKIPRRFTFFRPSPCISAAGAQRSQNWQRGCPCHVYIPR